MTKAKAKSAPKAATAQDIAHVVCCIIDGDDPSQCCPDALARVRMSVNHDRTASTDDSES